MSENNEIDTELVDAIKAVLVEELAEVDEVTLEVLSEKIAVAADGHVASNADLNGWFNMFLDAGAIAAGAAAMVMGQSQGSARITNLGLQQVIAATDSYQQRIADEATKGGEETD